MKKIFQYKTICHTEGPCLDLKLSGIKTFIVGETYDVYITTYLTGAEMEIFKDGIYYNTFLGGIIRRSPSKYDRDEKEMMGYFRKYFYTKEELRDNILKDILGDEI